MSLRSCLSTSQRVFFFLWVEHISLPFFMMVIEVVVTLIGFTALCFMEQTTTLSGYSYNCVLAFDKFWVFFFSMNVMIYAYKRCTVFFFFGKEWERKECLKGTWHRLFKLRTENRKIAPWMKCIAYWKSTIKQKKCNTKCTLTHKRNEKLNSTSIIILLKRGLILGSISWNNQHHPVNLINHQTTKKTGDKSCVSSHAFSIMLCFQLPGNFWKFLVNKEPPKRFYSNSISSYLW